MTVIKRKEHLRPIKKLINRGGKTFIATYYVSDEKDGADEDSADEVVEVKNVKGLTVDVVVGDVIRIKGVKSDVTGQVKAIGSSLYKGERYYYMEITTSEGTKTIASQKIEVEKLTSGDSKRTDSVSEFPNLLSELTLSASLGGSSDVKLYIDKNGKKFAVKSPNEKGGVEQLLHEVTADELYRKIGVSVPESRMIEGKKVSEFIEGRLLNSVSITEDIKKDLYSGFVMDVLLRNQDVIGDGNDNILIGYDSNVYRIDNGSTFTFRARGSKKEWESDTVIQDFNDFKSESYAAGKIFKDIPLEVISEQINQITANFGALSDIMGDTLALTFKRRLGKLALHVEKLINDKKADLELGEYDRAKYQSKVSADYFKDWDEFQIEGNPELKDTIKKNIENREIDRRLYDKDQAEKFGMDIEKYRIEMQKHTEELIEKSDFFIVAHLDNGFEGILKDNRFKTLFETGAGSGCCFKPSRSECELKRYGFPDDIDFRPEFRPISGYFTINKNGVINNEGTIPPSNRVDCYGDIIFKVKKEVAMKKATITYCDSLGTENRAVAVPASKPHYSFLPTYGLRAVKETLENKDVTRLDGGGYVEAQYHNQLKIEEIESIHIPKSYSEEKLTKFINMVSDFKADTGNKHLKVVVF